MRNNAKKLIGVIILLMVLMLTIGSKVKKRFITGNSSFSNQCPKISEKYDIGNIGNIGNIGVSVVVTEHSNDINCPLKTTLIAYSQGKTNNAICIDDKGIWELNHKIPSNTNNNLVTVIATVLNHKGSKITSVFAFKKEDTDSYLYIDGNGAKKIKRIIPKRS
jgi:hypothetical protein